jgi:hypothetical protein
MNIIERMRSPGNLQLVLIRSCLCSESGVVTGNRSPALGVPGVGGVPSPTAPGEAVIGGVIGVPEGVLKVEDCGRPAGIAAAFVGRFKLLG